MTSVEVRTGIWGDDQLIKLDFPDNWDIETYWPNTPAPLSDEEISKIIDTPEGQLPLRQLAKGKKRPCIIVDDLSRPTPAYKILPSLIAHFADAGIKAGDVKIIVGTGTHGHQGQSELRNKLGDMAMDQCQVIVHNDLENVIKIGKTSFGTPVFIDKDVAKCDLLIGVGGVYPQNTTGFGGGGKLILGVLGRRSIMGMHYRHPSMEGKYITDNDFRKDVTEMARIAGLDTIYTVHVNAYMEVVNLMCGDHYSYYNKAADFSRERYSAEISVNADVVIANAYPLDTSVTFMRKGFKPLAMTPNSAMKIMIASAYEGIGMHGLFRYAKPPRFNKLRVIYRKAMILGPKTILIKIINRILRKLKLIKNSGAAEKSAIASQIPENSDHLWLYRTTRNEAEMPEIPDMTVIYEWEEIIKLIKKNYQKDIVKVSIYPCAPLQTLDH